MWSVDVASPVHEASYLNTRDSPILFVRPALSAVSRSPASLSTVDAPSASTTSVNPFAVSSVGNLAMERKKAKTCSAASLGSRAPRTISCSVADVTYLAFRRSSGFQPSAAIASTRMAPSVLSVIFQTSNSASAAALRWSFVEPSGTSTTRGRSTYSGGTALVSRRYQPFASSGCFSSHTSRADFSFGTFATIASNSLASIWMAKVASRSGRRAAR